MSDIQAFRKARIELTVWSVLTIMIISILFSIAVYAGVNHELWRIGVFREFHRNVDLQSLVPLFDEFLKERTAKGLPIPPLEVIPYEIFKPTITSEVRGHLLSILALINLG